MLTSFGMCLGWSVEAACACACGVCYHVQRRSVWPAAWRGSRAQRPSQAPITGARAHGCGAERCGFAAAHAALPLSALYPGKTWGSDSYASRSATTRPSAPSTPRACSRTSCSTAPSTPSCASGARAWRPSPGAPSRWSCSGERRPLPAPIPVQVPAEEASPLGASSSPSRRQAGWGRLRPRGSPHFSGTKGGATVSLVTWSQK